MEQLSYERGTPAWSSVVGVPDPTLLPAAASEQRGNTSKVVKAIFYLKATARIWQSLSYVCHIRSTAGGGSEH